MVPPLNEVIVALGSNIDPERHFERARAALHGLMEVAAESEPVRTRPREFADQPDFLNGAVLGRTPLEAPALKRRLKEIEADLGRVSMANKAGPRTIDLDIVVWNRRVVDPHVREWDFLRDAVAALLPELELELDAVNPRDA